MLSAGCKLFTLVATTATGINGFFLCNRPCSHIMQKKYAHNMHTTQMSFSSLVRSSAGQQSDIDGWHPSSPCTSGHLEPSLATVINMQPRIRMNIVSKCCKATCSRPSQWRRVSQPAFKVAMTHTSGDWRKSVVAHVAAEQAVTADLGPSVRIFCANWA